MIEIRQAKVHEDRGEVRRAVGEAEVGSGKGRRKRRRSSGVEEDEGTGSLGDLELVVSLYLGFVAPDRDLHEGG